MPIHLQTKTTDYHLAVWKVTETLDGLLQLLPSQGACYSNTLQAFHSDARKIEWVAVRVLLYTLTGALPEIVYLSTGKPLLANGKGCISISHTKGYVAVVFSSRCEVGIDIERKGERVCRVAHKFVRDDEMPTNSFSSEMLSVLLIWSAKEVMFKRLGVEGVDFRTHLRVQLPVELTQSLSFSALSMHPGCSKAFLIHYRVDDEFVLTWSVGDGI